MLKNKGFWDDIEDMLNDEYSDFVVIDLFFTLETYMVLKDDLSELPVNQCKFYNIYHECERRLPKVLSPNTLKYIAQLHTIVKDVPNVRISVTIEHILDFVENNEKPYSLFCAMGVLKGIEDATTDEPTKLLLQVTEHGLLQAIKSL